MSHCRIKLIVKRQIINTLLVKRYKSLVNLKEITLYVLVQQTDQNQSQRRKKEWFNGFLKKYTNLCSKQQLSTNGFNVYRGRSDTEHKNKKITVKTPCLHKTKVH